MRSVVRRFRVARAPKTEFQRAFDEALGSGVRERRAQAIAMSEAVRILRIKILPMPGGVTVLWHDSRIGRAQNRRCAEVEERFALMEAGANDGLWEWETGSQEIHFSARWRVVMGLPARSGAGQLDDWLGRVHPDDIASLRQAIEAHLYGKTEQLHHEHRLLHENGTYRRYLCRGVAARGASGRAAQLRDR